MEPVLLNVPNSYLYCHSVNSPLTLFAVYQNAGFQIAQFFYINGDAVLSRSYNAAGFKDHLFPFVPVANDYSSYSSEFKTVSKFEANTTIRFERTPLFDSTGRPIASNLIVTSVKNSYPQSSSSQVSILCSEISK